MYFTYGQIETDYLGSRDRRMRELIDRIGPIRREVDDDLFSSVVHSIAGQQVSRQVQESVWRRVLAAAGAVTPESILALDPERLRGAGLSLRKVECIREFAARAAAGEFSRQEIDSLDDLQAVRRLVSLRGVGVWTAEMALLFCLRRPDVFSYGDFGIRRGLRILYDRADIDRRRFERYRSVFSPYGSVASLYLWELSARTPLTGSRAPNPLDDRLLLGNP